MASENLYTIMSVIKSFDKHPSRVKIITKALGSTFHFRKTSCNKVEKIIKNLNIKKSCRQEDIVTKIIKLNKDLITKFLAGNFSSYLDKGEFRSESKHYNIVQIYKMKDESNKSNYRPVSILSNYSEGRFPFNWKNLSRLKILPRISWVHAQFKHDCAISENRAEKLGGKKYRKFSTFLEIFLSWNINSQSDFVLISTTFFNMASRNETTREIYLGFYDCAIWNFLFQRQFCQPGGSPQ